MRDRNARNWLPASSSDTLVSPTRATFWRRPFPPASTIVFAGENPHGTMEAGASRRPLAFLVDGDNASPALIREMPGCNEKMRLCREFIEGREESATTLVQRISVD